MADCLEPSADKMAARLSRSARICFSIESRQPAFETQVTEAGVVQVRPLGPP